MRSRALLLTILLVSIAGIAPLTAHAGVPFFGPIIPQENVVVNGETISQAICPASWGLLIIVVNNLISLLLTLMITLVAPLTIAYAGFLLVINPAYAAGVSKAKSLLLHTVVGLVVAFAAWLIVDALMAVLYHPNGSVSGSWASIIKGDANDVCLPQKGVKPGATPNVATPGAGLATTPGTSQVGKAPGPCDSSNTACSPQTIQQGAQALSPSLSLTDAQAQALSCIAMTESSGNPNTPDSSTGACGLFQITNRPGNWSKPQFHQSPCNSATSCNNATCNLQTALLMFNETGYKPWTGKNPDGTYWNPNAVACAQKYDPTSSRI